MVACFLVFPSSKKGFNVQHIVKKGHYICPIATYIFMELDRFDIISKTLFVY